MRSKQRGFTLLELFFVLWFTLCVGFGGFCAYVAWHFISKFW